MQDIDIYYVRQRRTTLLRPRGRCREMLFYLMQSWLILLICAIILLLLFFLHVLVQAKSPLIRMIFAMANGVATLVAVNIVGTFTCVTLPISLLSLMIAAIVGFPGIISMLILNLFL